MYGRPSTRVLLFVAVAALFLYVGARVCAPRAVPHRRTMGKLLQLFGELDPYAITRGFPESLCVDVGAYTGETSEVQLKNGHRVKAFEPFVGNLAALQVVQGKSGGKMQIYHGAVGDFSGQGFLWHSQTRNRTSSLSSLHSFCNSRAWACTPVRVFRLDDEVNEPVLFLKIDVQGGELGVLEGARRLFDSPQLGVRFVYLEFLRVQSFAVLEFLYRRSYQCYDFPYMLVGNVTMLATSQYLHRVLRGITLTTKAHAIEFNVLDRPSELSAWYSAFTNDVVATQTDLLCVKPVDF